MKKQSLEKDELKAVIYVEKDRQIPDVPGCRRKVLGHCRDCPRHEEQFQEKDVHLEKT